MNDLDLSERHLRFAVTLATEEFGGQSLPTLDAILVLADWLISVDLYEKAIFEYRRIAKDTAPQIAGEYRALARALQGLSVAHINLPGGSADRGISYQARVLDLMEAHPREFPKAWRVLSYVRLGDLNVLFGRQEMAWKHYQNAWALVGAKEQGEWAPLFAEPHLIHVGDQLPYKASLPLENGDSPFFLFEFDIHEDGRPRNVAILDGNLHGTYRTDAIDAIRQARFRPRLVDGKAEVVERVRMRRNYSKSPPPGKNVPALCRDLTDHLRRWRSFGGSCTLPSSR